MKDDHKVAIVALVLFGLVLLSIIAGVTYDAKLNATIDQTAIKQGLCQVVTPGNYNIVWSTCPEKGK